MMERVPSKTRKQIGLILASIHTGSSPTLWKSVHAEAVQQGFDLFVFPGGPLEKDESYERQRNCIFPLVQTFLQKGFLDGIISWASSLGGKVPVETITDFHQAFRSFPCVTLSYPVEGLPCIWIDAYEGMKKLLDHFLDEHRVRSFAFIRGPATHISAEERYRAFRDTLRERGKELLFKTRLAGLFIWLFVKR
ncbi:MAG: substrate-binding domain-containing protein [Spirochaetales bacterium]